MNLPSHFLLGPHRYEIRMDSEALKDLQDDSLKGEATPDRLEVKVDSSVPHSQLSETVLHEALHCIWHQVGVDKWLDEVEDTEEALISALSPRILELLQRNPKLGEFLLGE